MWNCLRKKKRLEREFIVSQVLARHAAWFPAHNRGREAPAEALAAWARQLRNLPEAELILLLADNRSRNRQLGKVWPPGGRRKHEFQQGGNMTETQVREMEQMVNELMDIGRGDGFLSLMAGGRFNEKKRNIRAIEIGKKLNDIGGMDAMRMGGEAVRRFLNVTQGRELEVCWDGIGNWRG